MTWSPCATGAAYTVGIDWSGDGVFTGTGEDVTSDVLGGGRWSWGYGRDQARQLSPTSIGRAAFPLCNVDRVYSPENTGSILFGDLEPGRQLRISASFQGTNYDLFRGRIDDFEVHPDRSDRTVDFSSLDGLSDLQGVTLSTDLHFSLRTGEIVNIILDEAGWPADARDIDVGATYARYWWAENTDAFSALQSIVQAEGPPAIGYVAPDGTFVFRDRHHRVLRSQSLTSQATYAAGRVICDAPTVTGFDYTAPFVYQHGWRDIVNAVTQDVDERIRDRSLSVVWSTQTPFTIPDGGMVEIMAAASDPFQGAVTPTEDTALDGSGDFVRTGAGAVTVSLSRTSGQSTGIQFTASGGSATILNVQLRAFSVPVARTIQIQNRDAGSVTVHGTKYFPDEIPFATSNDVAAVAEVILAHYANRRPIVRMRVVSCDPDHLVQIFTRTLSDRITVRNDELGLNTDFFIERVDHTVYRSNPDQATVHSVVLGCERQLNPPSANPFTFDKSGAGFDDGYFGSLAADDPSLIWVWDTQSTFNTNAFGT